MFNVFATLVRQYLLANPQVVERLATVVLHGLIEHIAPTTAGELTGAASAAPLAELNKLTTAQAEVKQS